MSFCSAQKILLPGQVLVSKSLLIKGECKHTERQKESLVLTENEHQNSFAFLLCPLALWQLSVREPTMCLHIRPSEGLKAGERELMGCMRVGRQPKPHGVGFTSPACSGAALPGCFVYTDTVLSLVILP